MQCKKRLRRVGKHEKSWITADVRTNCGPLICSCRGVVKRAIGTAALGERHREEYLGTVSRERRRAREEP